MSYGIARDIATSATPEQVFAVLSDASREAEWNALVLRARKAFGNGDEGTVFRVRVHLGGREHPVDLTLQQARLPWVSLAGTSGDLDVAETFTIRAAEGGGSTVSISAIYTFRGWLHQIGRFLERRLEKKWDSSCAQLHQLLEDTAGGPGIPSRM